VAAILVATTRRKGRGKPVIAWRMLQGTRL
jgi:hypothetical protein